MQRKRRQKGSARHLVILVNEQATNYSAQTVERLVGAIRKIDGYYTILRPTSATSFLDTALAAVGQKRKKSLLPPNFHRRGKISSLIVCGGDGSFNLAARAALKGDLPVGVIPMGRFNNIANSLYQGTAANDAIKRVLAGTYNTIDVGEVGQQPFFGSLAIGLVPCLMRSLEGRRRPRLAMGWSRLAGQALGRREANKTIIKIDSFQFEVSPTVLNVNLLTHTVGLPFSPASQPNDQLAEVIFDVKPTDFGAYLRQLSRNKYNYGADIRMFRGRTITLQPCRGRLLYLDGELVELPDNVLEIELSSEMLKVLQ